MICATSVALMSLAACGDSMPEYDATGTYEATEVIVSAEGNGKLLSFIVDEGYALKAGETVGQIDTMQLFFSRRATLERAQSTVANMVDIQAQIAATRQQIAKQEFERARFEKLLSMNAARRKQLEDIESQIEVLQRQLKAQQLTFQNNNKSLTMQETALLTQVAQLDDQLAKCRIASPIDGVVLNKYAEEGELAAFGKALFKVADTKHLFLRAYVTSDQLASVRMGDQVTCYADFGEQQRTYEGTVTWISDKAEFTPKGVMTQEERANLVYAVKIAVENDGYIKIGMYGEVKFAQAAE